MLHPIQIEHENDLEVLFNHGLSPYKQSLLSHLFNRQLFMKMIAISRLLQLTQLNNSLGVRIIACIFLPNRIDTVIEPVLLKHSQHLMHTHEIGQIHHVDKWQVCLRLLTTTQAE